MKLFLSLSIIIIGLLSISIFLIFKSRDEKYKKYFLITCIIIALISGALVNPIETGLSYYDQEASQFAANIVKDNPNATWIMVNSNKGDIFLPVGAHTINSINTYPDLNKWRQFDENNSFLDDYNRYAHINIELSNDNPTSFIKDGSDLTDKLNIILNVNDLKDLNVSYIVSTSDISNFTTDRIKFEDIYKNNKLIIYRVDYA